MVCHMNKCYTAEALLATSSSYDHLYETPFELWLNLCNEKLSYATATSFGIIQLNVSFVFKLS